MSNSVAAFLVPAVLLFLCSAFIYWFFGTELGMCIRATGYNTQMVRAQGVNTDTMIIIGLFISNASSVSAARSLHRTTALLT